MQTERKDQDALTRTYELVVIGGGMSGVCAAIAAARLGSDVALIQDRPVLGGISSSEFGLVIGGAAYGGYRYARETGILEELRLTERLLNPIPLNSGDMTSLWDLVLWQAVQEAGVSLYLNCHAHDVVMSSADRLEAVLAIQLGTERRFRFEAPLFVDATGDGMIAALAGAEFRVGREAKEEFGESLAQEEADDRTLCSSLMFRARDMGRPAPFTAPPWAKAYPNEEDLKFRDHSRVKSGYWWIEYGGTVDTIGDNEEIRDELLSILLGVWDHIKNHGEHGAETLALEWISPIPGKRESRRVLGDYVLRQQDLTEATHFDDAVAYGGWWIDFHLSEGMHSREVPADNYWLQRPYSIPLRALYARDVDNLMLAGRDISVTHVALMSTRVMATCAVIGEAVGTAAALCRKHALSPRELAHQRAGEVQQELLKNDVYLIGVQNEDPDDLARGASVSASSTSKLEIFHAAELLPLDVERSQTIALDIPRLDALSLWLRNRASYRQSVTLVLYTASDFWDFEGVELTRHRVEIPPQDTGWITFDLDDLALPSTLVRMALLPAEDIDWGYAVGEFVGTQAAFRNPHYPEPELQGRGVYYYFNEWRYLSGSHCFRSTPAADPFGPQNVISGVARPEQGSNLWISDPREPLPQRLTLDLGSKRCVGELHLTFDTNLSSRMIDLQVPSPSCVKEYRLLAEVAEGWQEIVHATDNVLRKRVHRFTPVETRRLRIEVMATHGSPSARIYEVRLYEGQARGGAE
jgi:hypothetical protein